MLSQECYERGLFAAEQARADAATPMTDRKGAALHDDRIGKIIAQRDLEAHRLTQQRISFEINTINLLPDTVFLISGHPRQDSGERQRLLITSFKLEGTLNGE